MNNAGAFVNRNLPSFASPFIGIRSASYDWQMRPRYPQTAESRDNAKKTGRNQYAVLSWSNVG